MTIYYYDLLLTIYLRLIKLLINLIILINDFLSLLFVINYLLLLTSYLRLINLLINFIILFN